jgi:hypothetical protein
VLWINQGQGYFQRDPAYIPFPGHGVFADFDNDGRIDLVTTRGVFRNVGATFQLQAGSGIDADTGSTTITCADYDGDGLLDIFIGTGVSYKRVYNAQHTDSANVGGVGGKSRLYRNLGDFKFQEVIEQAFQGYPTFDIPKNAVSGETIPGYPVVTTSNWVDIDDDGYLDLFCGTGFYQKNMFWHNNGNGTFTNIAAVLGIEGHEKVQYPGMFGWVTGSDWGPVGDVGLEEKLDLALAQYTPPSLLDQADLTTVYVRKPSPGFIDASMGPTGLEYMASAGNIAMGDYDNDGSLDTYISTSDHCSAGRLYHFEKKGIYASKSFAAGVMRYGPTPSLAWTDIDNDGDLDIILGGDTASMFRNEGTPGNFWLAVRIALDSGANRFGIGSTITVYSGYARFIRLITAGDGARSQKPSIGYFGLGTKRIDSVEIKFPNEGDSSRRVMLKNIPANAYYTLRSLHTLDVESESSSGQGIDIQVVPNITSGNGVKLILNGVENRISPVEVQIYNLRGSIIESSATIPSNSNSIALDVSNVPTGYYIVRVMIDNKIFVRGFYVVR